MKKKFSLLVVGVMIFSILLVGCGSGGSNDNDKVENEEVAEDNKLEEILDSGKLILGTSADYPPFEFHTMIDGQDTIVGLDIEIAKYIADELGVELEIKDMDFDNLLGGLGTGMLDMVIAGMNPDPDRDANFTDIYYEATHSVVVTKDNPSQIATVEDLAGKSIGVQLGTTQEDIAKTVADESDVKSLAKNTDLIMNLKTEKIDCAIMETPVAESFVKVNDDLMVVDGLNFETDSGGFAIALKSGNDKLTERLNEILSDIMSKGLIDEWFIEADELSSKDI